MANFTSIIHTLVLTSSILKLLTIAFVLHLASSEDVTSSTSDCPRHCQCFTVSYSSPPQSWQIKQYMDQYQWEEGAKVVGCWGRGKIPQNVSPDVHYLLLLGNGKVKRRDKTQDDNDKKDPETIQSLQNSDPVDAQTGRKWRQIKEVADDAFHNMRDLVQLDLSGNKVHQLTSESFQRMRHLNTLSLKHNRLKILPEAVFRDLSKLTSLDISGNNMRYMPSELFRNNTNLISLDLSDNLLNYLPERSLHWLMHLQYMNISYNRLLDIPSRLLIDLIDIREIHLNDNKLRVIAYDMLHKNTKLEVLSLRNNRIRTLEEYAFFYQNNLRRLDLSGNKLVRIPNTVFWGTQRMLWLDLSNNNISKIDDGAFARIENLTELVLSDNTLDSITVNTLDELPKLRKLILARNNVTVIDPGSMQGLKMLEILDLSYNNLETIAAHTFYGLEELTDLHLINNRIKIIAPEAFKVSTFSFTSKLTWLNLLGNELSYLEPHAFYGAPNVKVLYLSQNHINMIDENSFHGLMSLKTLTLARNNLRAVETGQFNLLTRLESLDLSANSIENLAIGSLGKLSRLRELNLEDNYLNGNSFDWTNELTSLEELNLNKNAMRTMPSEVLLNLKNLRMLSLDQNGLNHLDIPLDSRLRLSKLSVAKNELRSFDQSMIGILQAGSKLDLSSNPWHCDCAMASAVNELLSWRVKFENVAETTCSSPQSVKHSLLYSLKPNADLCTIQNAPPNSGTDHEETSRETVPPMHSPCHTTYRLSTDPGVWPWHAVLWNAITRTAMCNGVLISPNWILSTLRCLQPHTTFGKSTDDTNEAFGHIQGIIPVPRHWVVKLGKSKNLLSFEAHEQIYSIMHVHVSRGDVTMPDWDRPILMELNSLASVSQFVLPICPADDRVDIRETTLTGWGAISRRARVPPKLLSVNFTSVPQCAERSDLRDFVCTEKNGNTNIRYTVYKNLGAPLVTHIANSWFLVGIITDSTPEETKFIDVRPYNEWLHQKMV